jgi:hypothetical protein
MYLPIEAAPIEQAPQKRKMELGELWGGDKTLLIIKTYLFIKSLLFIWLKFNLK